jgi:hypothetical protein
MGILSTIWSNDNKKRITKLYLLTKKKEQLLSRRKALLSVRW